MTIAAVAQAGADAGKWRQCLASLLFAASALIPLFAWTAILVVTSPDRPLADVGGRLVHLLRDPLGRWLLPPLAALPLLFLFLAAVHWRARAGTGPRKWVDALGLAATVLAVPVCWPAAIPAGFATWHGSPARYERPLPQAIARVLRILRAVVVTTLVAFLLGLAGFFIGKLYEMAAIRGWVPGAVYRTHVITDMQVLDGDYGPAYWIAWDGAPIARRSHQRENLERDQWARLAVGDTVTMAYYRDDPTPNSPDGIYVSLGNFVFDIVLLSCALLLACVLGRPRIRALRAFVRNRSRS